MMLKGENAHQVIGNVKERIKVIQQSLPEGVTIQPYLDRTDLVGRAIGTVTKNLLEGGLIVVLVLVLLLGNLRAGLIVASVIPLSMENQGFIELQQNYLESRSKLEYAEGEFKRHKELYKDDVSSAKNFQEVTANYKSLKAGVTALAQKLSLIGIDASRLREDNITSTVPVISPISGYIKTVNINLGKFIGPEDVMEILSTSTAFNEISLRNFLSFL